MALDFLVLLFVPGKLSAQDRVAAVVSWTKLSNLTIKISDLTTGLTKTYGEPKQKSIRTDIKVVVVSGGNLPFLQGTTRIFYATTAKCQWKAHR